MLENGETVPYDKLIIATGARPKIPDIKGINGADNIFTIRRIEDGIAIRDKMRSSKRAVILGSGYIGLEILEAFVKNGLQVDLIEHNDNIMPRLDSDMAEIIRVRRKSSAYKNFHIHLSDTISEVKEVSDKLLITTENGEEIETDFLVIASGVVPNPRAAHAACCPNENQ